MPANPTRPLSHRPSWSRSWCSAAPVVPGVVVVVVVVGVPSGGFVAARLAGGVGRRRRLDGAVHPRVGHDVVEDVAHERGRGLGAVSALVDHGQHEVGGFGLGPNATNQLFGSRPAWFDAVPVLPARFHEAGKPWKSCTRCRAAS